MTHVNFFCRLFILPFTFSLVFPHSPRCLFSSPSPAFGCACLALISQLWSHLKFPTNIKSKPSSPLSWALKFFKNIFCFCASNSLHPQVLAFKLWSFSINILCLLQQVSK
jgi:hypothetical protein